MMNTPRRTSRDRADGLLVRSASSSPIKAARSVTRMIGRHFETEVNSHLEKKLTDNLSGCRISDLRSRQIDYEHDDYELEIDSFGYVFSDEGQYGRERASNGIFLVQPNGCGRQKPKMQKNELKGSPAAITRGISDQVEKYIIGESYSGQSESVVRRKVATLEERVQIMLKRYSENHPGQPMNGNDVTGVVGAVLLCFSTGSKTERKNATKYFHKLVCVSMGETTTPILWRMASARRFFLVVLSESENPIATSFRQVAIIGETTQLLVENLETKVVNLEMKVGNIETKVENLERKVGNIETKVENLERKVGNIETMLSTIATSLGISVDVPEGTAPPVHENAEANTKKKKKKKASGREKETSKKKKKKKKKKGSG